MKYIYKVAEKFLHRKSLYQFPVFLVIVLLGFAVLVNVFLEFPFSPQTVLSGGGGDGGGAAAATVASGGMMVTGPGDSFDYPSYPSYPGYPSYPSYPTYSNSYPSYPTYPSYGNSYPSYPAYSNSYPSYPAYGNSYPSYPSYAPNYPSYPTYPSYRGTIRSRVFLDINGNGVREAGLDPFILDVGITCPGTADGVPNYMLNNVLVSRLTGPSVFSRQPQSCGLSSGSNPNSPMMQAGNVKVGNYKIRVNGPSGWTCTLCNTISAFAVPANGFSAMQSLGITAPDYIVDNMNQTPGSPAVGQPITFSGRVVNMGGANATANSQARLRFDRNNDGTWVTILPPRMVSPLLGRAGAAEGGSQVVSWANAWTPVAIDVGRTHTFEICGDSTDNIVEIWNSLGSSNCSTQTFTVLATPPLCGNATVEGAEQCDDGNGNNNDVCKNNCTNNICGDSFVRTGVEQCDDGNLANGDGCSSACTIEIVSFCGNGITEAGEQCDDGNVSNTDACTNSCFNAVCGDGFVRGGVEQCDDSNTTSGDGCSATCQNEVLCVDDCSPSGIRECVAATSYRTCGNFDADLCLDWGPANSCPVGNACTGAGSCTVAGDFSITSDFSIITMIQPFPNPGFIFSSPIKFRTTPVPPFASNLRFSVDAPIRNVDGSSGTGITTGFGTDFNTTSVITPANYNDPTFRLSFRTRITSDTVPGRYILKIRVHDEDDVLADKVMDIKLDVVNPTPGR